MKEKIVIRKYRPQDAAALAELFYQTVHAVNAEDYTPLQLDAWAPKRRDMDAWNRSFLEHSTYIAVLGADIVGFGDIDETGYLDRLYVHKDYQHMGVASALCDRLEKETNVPIYTHASVTARPFFEKRGYRMAGEQQVERKGVFLKNYVMKK